jgi:hypothetical protein
MEVIQQNKKVSLTTEELDTFKAIISLAMSDTGDCSVTTFTMSLITALSKWYNINLSTVTPNHWMGDPLLDTKSCFIRERIPNEQGKSIATVREVMDSLIEQGHVIRTTKSLGVGNIIRISRYELNK